MAQTVQAPLLSVQDLRTYFYAKDRIAKAVDGVNLEVRPSETLGIVGESGSGKTVTAMSVMRLLPAQARIVSGKILFDGCDLAQASDEVVRSIRGKQIGMVFQDPMTSLNPLLTIGDHVAEPMLAHGASAKQARTRAVEMLERVGIPEAASRLKEYPHRFSGGMRQRVMIAMALINSPRLLIADEPTTALDVTIQAQVLELFRKMRDESGTAVLLITHNLGIVAGMADRVAVMYAGRVVEYASTDELFANPRHPYTIALLNAVPRPGYALASIPGAPPNCSQLPAGCAFYERCAFHEPECVVEAPPMISVARDHIVSCRVDVRRERAAEDPQ
jgi:oligopeptide/dipeptide ABC transporter ATP-binding protein